MVAEGTAGKTVRDGGHISKFHCWIEKPLRRFFCFLLSRAFTITPH